MTNFIQQLQAWQLFFATVAAADATLTGLLFVSLSLNWHEIVAEPGGWALSIARRSFGDFLYVLMLSLVFLVPHREPFSLAIALLVLGLSRGLGLIRQMARVNRVKAHHPRGLDILRQYALPVLACLGLLAVAGAVMVGGTIAIYGLVLVVAALLTTASWNAWLLLVRERHN